MVSSICRKLPRILRSVAALILLFISQACYGQFSFETGVTLVFAPERSMNFVDERPTIVNGNMTQQGDTSYYSYDYSAGGVAVLMHPRVGIVNMGSLNLSIGAPLNIGFSGSASSDGESSMSFVIDLNLAVDVNGGNYNKKNESSAPFGYYLGIGYGLTNTTEVGYELNHSGVNSSSENLNHINSRDTDPASMLTAKNSGIMFHGGIGKFAFMENAKFVNKLGVRLAYRPSLGRDVPSYTMASILLHF